MGPLDGLLVVELASVLAGPTVGMFFAEHGARVVKVEGPRGDVTRRWHLATEDAHDDRPAYFCAVNWGKESVGLDLSTDGGRRLAHDLVARADLVVSSFRPGTAARLGVDAATLQRLNPRAVIVEVDGYGPGDPRAGYDAVIQAEAGFMFLNGPAQGSPTKMPVALVDLLAAHQLKEAALVALLARERTGRGAHVRVSLLGAAVASLANQASNWLTAGVAPQRMGSAHPNIAPYGRPYPTATGDLVVAVGTDRQFAALCDVLGVPALADDPRFATNAARVRHREALDRALTDALATRDRDGLLEALAARGVPAGAVRDLPAVFAQPEAARLVVRDGEGHATVRTVATGETRPLSPPPGFAAHTRAILVDSSDIGGRGRAARGGRRHRPPGRRGCRQRALTDRPARPLTPLVRTVLLTLLLATAAHAQPATVEGTVRDTNGVPLPGASVYLSGTMRGAPADRDGHFRIEDVPPGAYRLVGSLVGYKPTVVEVRLTPGRTVTHRLVLAAATLALGDVQVEGERDRRWQRRLDRFTTVLLGESDNAAETTLLNPEVLDFRSRWGELRATARAPLQIENRALGYRLTYDLHTFTASATSVRYHGDDYFEALTPASPEQAARWEAARARAYRGSLRHLLRALLAGTVDEEGFSLLLHQDDPFSRRPASPGLPVSAGRILRLDAAGWGMLRLSGSLAVTYRGEPEEPSYLRSEWYSERHRRPENVQRSMLLLDRGVVRIDPQGTPEDPFAIATTGYLAFERLADLVPAGYSPPPESPAP